MAEKSGIVKILLVEDNSDDILITKRAFKETKLINKMWVVRDGQEALDFLYHNGKYQDVVSSPKPGLMLLDINLPKLNGLSVLKKIKEDRELRRIPIVMLTASKRDEDVVRGYDNGCNSFIQKPVEFEKFVEIVRQIGLYWSLLNAPPPNNY